MKKISRLILLFTAMVIVFSLTMNQKTTVNAADNSEGTVFFENGEAQTCDNIHILNLHGSWYEMGRQYGYLANDQLEDVFEFCKMIIDSNIGNADTASNIVETQVLQMPYTVREFFRGAAETSRLTVEELYVANAVERIAGLPAQCSFAAVWDDYAADPMIIGRNYDYGDIFSALDQDIIVAIFNPCDGALSAATVSYAGEIYVVNAMNEAGMFMELNNGKPSAPISAPNERISGTTLIFDVIFETDSFDFLDRYFNTMLNSSSYIINAANGKEVRSYEWCPEGTRHGEDYNKEGLLVSTNHYMNPEWNLAEITDETSWNSLTRRDNLIRLCENNKGNIDAEVMKSIIATDMEHGGAENEETMYQLVADPGNQILWVKTVKKTEWVRIDLKEYWGKAN